MAVCSKDTVLLIPEDLSFTWHPDSKLISTKARQRGHNYWMKGFIHDININSQDCHVTCAAKSYTDP